MSNQNTSRLQEKLDLIAGQLEQTSQNLRGALQKLDSSEPFGAEIEPGGVPAPTNLQDYASRLVEFSSYVNTLATRVATQL
jgi:hypothetical protein